MEGGEFLGRGEVRGWLHFTDGYPGLVLDAAGGCVKGELWDLPGETLEALDEYEQACVEGVDWAGFRKVRATIDRVDDTSGDPVEAWVWEWTGVRREECRVESADWIDVGLR